MSTLSPLQATFLTTLKIKLKKREPLSLMPGKTVLANEAFAKYREKEIAVINKIYELRIFTPDDKVNKNEFDEFNVKLGKLEKRVEEARQVIGSAKKTKEGTDVKDAKKKIEEATSLLEGIEKDVVNEFDTAKKRSLEEARHKPVYEDKVRRINEAISQLKALPGTADFVSKLEDLKINAERLQKKGYGYSSMYEALEGLSGTLEKGLKAAKEFRETPGGKEFQKTTVGKNFQKAFQLAEDQLQQFEQLAGLAEVERVEKARETIENALRVIDKDPKQAVTQTGILKGLADGLKNDREDIKKHEETATPLKEEVAQTLLAELRAIVPAEAFESAYQKYLAACSLYGAQRYEDAVQAFTDLKGELAKDPYKKCQESFTTWQENEKKFDELANNKKRPNLIGDPLSNRINVVLRIYDMAKSTASDDHDYPAACKEIRGLIAELPKLQGLIENSEKLKDRYKDLEIKKKDYTDSVGMVESKINDLKSAGGSPGEFPKQLNDLKVQWTDVLNLFFVLDPTFWNSSCQPVFDGLNKIISEVDDVLNDKNPNGKLEQSKKDKEKEDLDTLRRVDIPRAMKNSAAALKLLKLEGVDAKQIDLLQKRFDVVEQIKPEQRTADHYNELLAIAKEAGEKIAERQKKLREDADKKLKEIAKFRDNIQKLDKEYAPLLAKLDGRLIDCEGLLESNLASAITQGLADLAILQKDIDELAGKPNSQQNVPSPKQVENKIKAMKKLLDDETLKTCLPARYKVFKFRIGDKELPTHCRETTPAKAMNLLEAFEKEVLRDKELAKQNAELRTQIINTADEYLKDLEKIGGLKDESPHLFAKLKKQLEAVKTINENGEVTAGVNLKAIKVLMDDVKDPGKKRQELEMKANQDLYEAKETANEWQASADLFEKNEVRDAKERYDEAQKEGGANKDAYKEIDKLFSAAKDAAKKKDFDGAKEKLKDARAAFTEFMRNPLSAAATRSNELRNDNEEWKKAAGTYCAILAKIKMDLLKESTQPVQGLATTAVDKLKPVNSLFDPLKFENVVAVLANENAELKEQRDMKEAGLRFLRNYRKIIASNKIIQHLKKDNPYEEAKVLAAVKAMGICLNNLERNIVGA